MDNADIRRGQPTVHVKWNQTVGILSGDMMLVKAIELLCETKTERLREMLTVFNTTAIQVCEGQQIDMNFEQRADVSVEEYIGMITLKTAVLLGGALKLGAIAANASDEDAQHIYEFGKHIGIAFQVQDDILDSFGEGDQVGKKIGGDIAANKKTLLLIKALELAHGNTRAKLQQLLNDKNIATDAKIEQVLAIYNELNVKPFADTLKQQHLQQAFEHLDKVSTDHDSKIILRHTAHELMERIK
jgi:geranylgeranyl diphosphate synthase, type II